ncbi:MAG TPA: putative Ig domain-containing protein [Dinghuibacter sp.]|uniref:putative Ig domain-containing protein n=1 Tax=Dinghuibacter sp. TaxID=2024697 RepID=UPI002BE60A05|nr:putative Ig domain-containing protein [Dinghuibacter sp.]HTJ13201.1 putative Ig domain-containing protein [Dinghuibacter sp.]
MKRLLRSVTPIILCLVSFASRAGYITATAAGGHWTATTTWVGGIVPGPTDIAIIPAGSTVLVDAGDLEIPDPIGGAFDGFNNPASIIVYGTFNLADANYYPLFLRPVNIYIPSGGKMADLTINEGYVMFETSHIYVYSGGTYTAPAVGSYVYDAAGYPSGGDFNLYGFNPGNTSGPFTLTVALDQPTFAATTPPALPQVPVNSVAYPGDNQNFATPQYINFYVTWTSNNIPLTVTGSPYIDLTLGNKTVRAVYIGTDGVSSTAYFAYQVQPGDYAAPGHLTLGNVIHLNGGNITLNDGLPVSTDLSAPASPLPVPTNITVASPAPPIVSTPTATNITTAGAKLNAFVDDSGGATAVTFRYGTDPTMTSATTVAATPATIAAGTGNTAVTTTLTGLANSTQYYYQVVAQNSAATVPSNIQTFHTAPVVYFISYPADGTYGAGQILHFYVSWTPGEGPFTVTGTPTIDLTIGHKKVTVTANGADPTASTVYFIYTVQPGDYATGTLQLGPVIHLNGGAILDQYGDQVDTSLTNPVIPTSPTPGNVNVIAPAPPIASNAPADMITSTGATVYGYVDDSAANTAVTFVYGTDPALSGGTTTVPGIIPTIAAGTGNTLDSAILTGLTPSTTYYYQVVAVNSQGTATGTPILHFTTAPDAAPVVTTTGGTTMFYATGTNSVAVAVDPGVTVSDVDNTTLVSATITIATGFASGDVLKAPSGGGFTTTYNVTTGVLTITASPAATLAQWNTELQSITFDDRKPNPTLGNRTVNFTVNDGTLNSIAATKTVSVALGLAFTGGSSQSASYCANSSAQDFSSLLAVSDLATGDNLTYGIVAGPANGSLTVNPSPFTSNGGTMTPTGMTYTPTPGYSGTDAFTISVTNGTLTAQIVINVTINAQPAAPAITGASSVCSGSTITLTGNPTGGAWTTGNSAVATVDASGVVTGVAQGNTNIVYTVTNGFGCTNNATSPVAVNPVPATPGAIAGSAAVHNEQTGVAYSVTNDPTVTYTWSYTPPAGVTINGTGNAVTLDFGPTAASGTLSVVAVSNCSISSAASTLPVTVSAPAITVSPSTLTAATVGAAYTASITASNGSTPYTFAVTAGSLPAGLSLSSGGSLSGTPTAGGSFNFTVTTTDTYGFPGSQSYTLTVNPAIITLTPTLPAATVGVVYSQSITATGGTSPYTYAVTSGSLPAGLTLASDGTLSGTPTAGGSFTFAVTATDASTGTGPYTGTQSYSFTVNPAGITLTPTLPAAAVGVAYSQTVTATGGTSPYTYAVTSGSLPAGLTLASDGTLSGTPTAGGSFNFTITATDASTGSGPYTGSQSYTLTVNAASIVVAPATLPAATVGVAYSQSISATGGTSPYTYAVTSGSLPAGLTLASDGTLSGTPTAGGSFTFTITATDASTGTGPYTGSQSYTLVVNAPAISLTPTTLPNATIAASYTASVSATGGTGPYTYAITAGNLPAGLTLASDGTLSGTPTAGGSFTFTITATDASTGTGPYTGSQAYTLVVNAPVISLAPTTLPNAMIAASYNASVGATGGTSPYTYAVTSGSLPAGLTLASDGTISGTPTAGGSFTFTVTATDASTGAGPYTGSQSYTLTVNAPAGISVAPATLPAGSYGQVYAGATIAASGGTSPYTYAVTSGSLPPGLTLASDGTLSGTPTLVGDYTFTVTATDASTGAGPYTGSATYTVHIAPATLTITANGQSMTYGGTVPALTVTYSGFINGDNSASLTTQPTITTTATSASGVGQYPITASGAVDPNYNIVYVNGTLTINPASLLVTAAPVTRYFNTPNPPLTYTFSGFVNGDDASVLTSQPSISTTAVQTSPPGQYPITLSGGTAANYTLLYQDAVLTVVQSLNNVITFNPLPVHTYGDPDFLISATANSGLAVRFVSQDTTIATVYQDGSGNWMVHIVAAGQVTISAFQDGDGMYAPAPEVDQSLQINKASQTITFAALPADAVTGQTLTLSASSSAGLPVSFTLSDPTLGALSGNQLQITGTGTLTVTANQPGNNDYLPAPPVSYTINIFNSAGFHSGIGVFPNPAHGTIHIRFTSDYLITKYIIFGINGQVVRSETDVSTNSNDLQVDVGTLQPGYYLVRVVCIRNNEIVYPVFKVLIY